MIRRVAVLPQPPLLIPELAAGAADECAELREACLAAVRRLTSASPDWIVIGAATGAPEVPEHASGSFRGFGVDLGVSLSRVTAPETELPLPALVAGWLREQVGASSVRVHLVDAATPSDQCEQFARAVGDHSAVLVLGDGSSRHGPRSPGGEDARAEDFDAGVRDALAKADTGALAALDPALAAELGAGGRAPWQVLAGLADGDWTAEVLYSAAPFGVGYHVAVWERA
ncbi:aromatic ring-opening dioxygenase LigB [Amycolatopsis sp. MJM2582]|uniref:class III extradiol dioxygenase subunit B-like domain-containing protein n=1 Tax=Amycolatopsis sp. MJM2582 TaxID=1427749 RepID=UPI0005011540|nr:class III extradiol dioxygenase subunit B-like domain-containing protein [Amycolatopsis sp. MJM2582]KFZ79393.1 aromatic ring-opening dioxygenase LigB [Amycolatopsis sp. MJM2582]